jgi:hypothetical protein
MRMVVGSRSMGGSRRPACRAAFLRLASLAHDGSRPRAPFGRGPRFARRAAHFVRRTAPRGVPGARSTWGTDPPRCAGRCRGDRPCTLRRSRSAYAHPDTSRNLRCRRRSNIAGFAINFLGLAVAARNSAKDRPPRLAGVLTKGGHGQTPSLTDPRGRVPRDGARQSQVHHLPRRA